MLRNIVRQPAGRMGILLGLIAGVVTSVVVTCTKIWQAVPPVKQENPLSGIIAVQLEE